MATRNLLYARSIPINDYISVMIPTVGEVLEEEDDYYSIVSLITASPYDMMVQLDDLGIDFSLINDYELFLIVFAFLKESDTTKVFGDLDLRKFSTILNQENGTIVLRDEDSGITIDRAIHDKICSALRKMHRLDKEIRKPGNDEAKKYMIERARQKMKRRKNRVEDSHLEELIVALVNTEQFGYGYEDVKNLTIYQFNQSVHQIVQKIDYDNRMHGVYAGTVSAKDLSQKDFNWLTHK